MCIPSQSRKPGPNVRVKHRPNQSRSLFVRLCVVLSSIGVPAPLPTPRHLECDHGLQIDRHFGGLSIPDNLGLTKTPRLCHPRTLRNNDRRADGLRCAARSEAKYAKAAEEVVRCDAWNVLAMGAEGKGNGREFTHSQLDIKSVADRHAKESKCRILFSLFLASSQVRIHILSSEAWNIACKSISRLLSGCFILYRQC